jgi:hypothetical protein
MRVHKSIKKLMLYMLNTCRQLRNCGSVNDCKHQAQNVVVSITASRNLWECHCYFVVFNLCVNVNHVVRFEYEPQGRGTEVMGV